MLKIFPIRTFILVVILLFMALPARSEEKQIVKLSLDDVVREARENNPEILAAKEKWLAAERKIPQVRTWPDPQIGIMWENIPRDKLSLGDASMRTYNIFQMIPFPGKLALKARVAKRSAQMAEQMYKAKELEIITKVKKAYYKLFFIHKAIEINRRNKDLLQILFYRLSVPCF